MKKAILKVTALAIAVMGSISIMSCDKEEINEDAYVSNMVKSDCLGMPKSSETSEDSIVFNYENHTLFVEHHNHIINCGHDSISVSVNVANDTIWIKELDFGEEANCICNVTNSYQINNLEKGRYVVVVRNCTRMGNYPEGCRIVYQGILNI